MLSCGEGAPAFGRPYKESEPPMASEPPEAYEFLQLIMDRALLKPAIRWSAASGILKLRGSMLSAG